jgi:endonuclease YncB( thermonuclease family)
MTGAGLISAYKAFGQYIIAGPTKIVDGDTIKIGPLAIRLDGIDAPEAGQKCKTGRGRDWACGKEAINQLGALAEGEIVQCKGSEWDDYDRLIAVCELDETVLNEAMMRKGMAWAFVKYADDYVHLEREARAEGIGVWQGHAEPPWKYREQKWQVAKQEAPEGCPIKGNITRNGKIYHPPWSPWYSRTKIDVDDGERWFCSEREALDAGWRAPRWR